MTLILVRHGESTHNIQQTDDEDPELTPRGVHQSYLTSEFLMQKILHSRTKHVKVFISPLSRTSSTSDPFLRLLNDNRYLFDSIDAHYSNQVIEYFPSYKSIPPSINVHHDESWANFIQRVYQFNQSLKENLSHQGTTIVIFGHRMFISALLTLQIIQEKHVGSQKLGICSLIDNCSISEIHFKNKHDFLWQIKSIGNIQHLMK
jgi:broad specificity phosphatase PhoE